MSRSRLVVLSSAVVVSVGALAAVGAFYLDPARAAVGPLPPQGLSLPAGTRFLMGIDVKRFVASPFYTRYAAGRAARCTRMKGTHETRSIFRPSDIAHT